MPTANIIELRQLLAERFPGLRTRADELSAAKHAFWPTGVPQLDASLRGGFAEGALSEIVAEQRGSGSALLLTALIHRALSENKFVAVIDGQDSLDVTQLGEDLSRLLWVLPLGGRSVKSRGFAVARRKFAIGVIGPGHQSRGSTAENFRDHLVSL